MIEMGLCTTIDCIFQIEIVLKPYQIIYRLIYVCSKFCNTQTTFFRTFDALTFDGTFTDSSAAFRRGAHHPRQGFAGAAEKSHATRPPGN